METFTVPTAKYGCGLLSDNRSKIPLFPKLCYNVRVARRENQNVFTQYGTLYVKQKHHKLLAIHKEPSLLEARRSMSEVYDTLADRLLHLVTSKSGSTVKHLVGMAGPPGAGKSTVAAEVVKRLNKYGKTSSVDFQESTDVAAVLPMDGFHLYRSQLDAMDNPKEAHARRGAPWTFDPERLLSCLKNLRTQGYVYAPSFDHGVGDPVEDDILVNIHHKVVIVEGNYLLLEDGVWKEISLEFDEKWFIDLAIDTAMERVRKRHISTGKTPEIARWRIEYNDRPNAELILKSRKNADIVIREEALSLSIAKATAMAAYLLSSPCAIDKLAGRSCLWAGKSRAAPGFLNGEMMDKKVKAINVGKNRLERMSLNHLCSTAFSNGVCDTIKVQDQLGEEVVNVKEMHQVLIMNGGVGETSYAINSLLQKTAMCTAMPMLQKAVADLCTTFSGDTIRLADLGCSSGPNTLDIVTFLIESFIEKLRQLGRRSPEFQVFLNDLPINDFNTLFLSLPPFYERLRGEKNMVGEEQGSCFVAGVPGSFYSRLFPSRSLHLIHSSYSVHWLSQVPPLLQSTATLPANKGNIFMAKTSPPSVFASYLNQFQKDFSLFLNYRKEELVPGGKMVVNLIGRRSPDHSSRECCRLWELLSESLKDMALEGIIEKEKLDTYNMPYYTPSSYEIRRIVEKEGSFDVEIKVTEVNWDPVEDQMKEDYVFEKAQSGKNVAKYIRASNESMLGYHFGEAVMDDLFERFADKVGDHLSKEKTKHVNLVVSLTRKG